MTDPPSASTFVHTILNRAHSPTTASVIYTDRISKRALPIRPNSPTPSARALRRRALTERAATHKQRAKNRPRPLSAAKKRALGLNEIPREQCRYEVFEKLHGLWVGYMQEVLGIQNDATEDIGSSSARPIYVTPSTSGQLLATADMHGALLKVVRSRCVSRVGIEGIVARDTRGTFEIVTKKNKLKAVPKEHTVFRFEVPLPDFGKKEGKEDEEKRRPLVFEIQGEQFQIRAPDRANKRFRIHYQTDL